MDIEKASRSLRLGATKKEILKLLEMCLPPAGLPAFMQGFDVWRKVFEVRLKKETDGLKSNHTKSSPASFPPAR